MPISLKFKKIRGNLIHSTAVINWNKIKIGKDICVVLVGPLGNGLIHLDLVINPTEFR